MGLHGVDSASLSRRPFPKKDGLALCRAKCLAGLFGHSVHFGWPVAWCGSKCFMYRPPPDGVVETQFLHHSHRAPYEEVSREEGDELLSRYCIDCHRLWHDDEWHTNPGVSISAHILRDAERRINADDFVFVLSHGEDDNEAVPLASCSRLGEPMVNSPVVALAHEDVVNTIVLAPFIARSSVAEATCSHTDDISCTKAVPLSSSSVAQATSSRADDASCAKAVPFAYSCISNSSIGATSHSHASCVSSCAHVLPVGPNVA